MNNENHFDIPSIEDWHQELQKILLGVRDIKFEGADNYINNIIIYHFNNDSQARLNFIKALNLFFDTAYDFNPLCLDYRGIENSNHRNGIFFLYDLIKEFTPKRGKNFQIIFNFLQESLNFIIKDKLIIDKEPIFQLLLDGLKTIDTCFPPYFNNKSFKDVKINTNNQDFINYGFFEHYLKFLEKCVFLNHDISGYSIIKLIEFKFEIIDEKLIKHILKNENLRLLKIILEFVNKSTEPYLYKDIFSWFIKNSNQEKWDSSTKNVYKEAFKKVHHTNTNLSYEEHIKEILRDSVDYVLELLDENYDFTYAHYDDDVSQISFLVFSHKSTNEDIKIIFENEYYEKNYVNVKQLSAICENRKSSKLFSNSEFTKNFTKNFI